MKGNLMYLLMIMSGSLFGQTINFNVYRQDANCKGANNGQAEVNVISMDPPYTYSWSNGSTNHIINDLPPGTYVCVITDYSGDDTTVAVVVHEIPCDINAESIFTPNGDGYNDNWDISSTSYYPDMKVMVYNRWGQKIYESAGAYEPWDGNDRYGNPAPDNSYYYIIYGDKKDEGSIVKGSVSILR